MQRKEFGMDFAPDFAKDNGLVPVIVQSASTGEVLMLAYMNEESLNMSIDTGYAHYYSRSRAKLWKKGETSGHTQRVVEMRVDCDQDAVWIRVEQTGAGACHTGRATCFYRAVPLQQADFRRLILEFRDAEKVFDPAEIYGANEDASGR